MWKAKKNYNTFSKLHYLAINLKKTILVCLSDHLANNKLTRRIFDWLKSYLIEINNYELNYNYEINRL